MFNAFTHTQRNRNRRKLHLTDKQMDKKNIRTSKLLDNRGLHGFQLGLRAPGQQNEGKFQTGWQN